ncbi:MAG: GntR family transcriptional regulator [bacterium]
MNNSFNEEINLSSLRNSKMKTKVYNVIMKEILSGQFQPGDKILIKNLSGKYNVSTTPIREALTKLENEGVLSKEPYKSYEIREYSYEEIKKIYEARMIIEIQVVKLATKKLDKAMDKKFRNILARSNKVIQNEKYEEFNECNSEFHFCIFETADNDYLLEMMENINKQIMILNYQAFPEYNPQKIERLKEALKEHQDIYDYIKNKNGEEASNLMKKHLLKSLKRFQ